jgi:HEAT repeat protein
MTEKPNVLDQLIDELTVGEPAALESAVEKMRSELGKLDGADYRRAIEALSSLFYVDTADRPDLESPVDRATEVLAEEGAKVVSILLAQMEGSDIKSHLYLARILGRIGCDALPKLRDYLATAEDPYSQSFALYALGKLTCPELAYALPEVLGCLIHPDKEVRDSAARTLGKIAEVVPAEGLTEEMRGQMFEALLRASRYHQAPVRAKSFRSLGKMVRAGLLIPAQTKKLKRALDGSLGEGDSTDHTWDKAFIVRREAKEALRAIKGVP